MQDVRVWCAAATHREQLEEGVLENLPLLVLIGDHGNVDFAEILREEKDQTHRAVRKRKKRSTKKKIKRCGKALIIAPLFFHFFDLVLEFPYFSQVRIYQYAPLQPAGPTCLPAEVFLECVSQIVYNYVTISHKMSSQSVRLRFFFFFSCQSDWIVSNSKRSDRPGWDWIPRFPLCRALPISYHNIVLFFLFCLLLLLLLVNIQIPNLDHCYNDPTGKSCQLRPRTRWTFGWTRPNQIRRVSDVNHMSHSRPARWINSIHLLYAAHNSLKGMLLS